MSSSTALPTGPQVVPPAMSKIVAAFGEWESEITKEAIFRDTWSLGSPRVDRRSERAFFTESRADGVTCIREVRGAECHDVLPPGYSARSRIYEYGGDPYALLSDGRIIFSNFSDNAVYILNVDSGQIKCLIRKGGLRYAAFNAHPGEQPWVLVIEEHHVDDVPGNVTNHIVLIDTETAEVKRIAAGADFYMFPTISYGGKKVCWVEWNFPDMPWTGVKLYWADFNEDGTLEDVELVAGHDRMSVTEPRWGLDGYLYFCQEQTNFRQLYRRRPGDDTAMLLTRDDLGTVEFGLALMFCGGHSYAILSEDCIVAVYTDNGANTLVTINPQTLDFARLPLSITDVHWDGIDGLSNTSFLLVGCSATRPQALFKIEIESDGTKVCIVRQSTDQVFPESAFSIPEHIEFPVKKSPERTVHGFFWPPHNPRYREPDGEKAPLIVLPHGGPTEHCTPGLKLRFQYWTSRGYALYAINYTGSDGHGKSYRDMLDGNWGITDVEDVAESVQYLSDTGRINITKIGIKGGSAGGYNVLQALCCYPNIFAGGVCLYGVSDVKLLLETTHKMESQYVSTLLFPNNNSITQDEREKIMYDRAPVYHAGNIRAPLLLLHGKVDKVVPVSQSQIIYDDIKKRGCQVELITFEGEGHGFRKGENMMTAMQAEEEWWKKTLVRSHTECESTCTQQLSLPSLFPVIFDPEPIENIVTLHCVLFATQYACAKSWLDCGLKVDRLIGHSFGQLTALCVAGSISLFEAMRLLSERARLVEEHLGPQNGVMLAVEGTDVDRLLRHGRQQYQQFSADIACYNGPRSIVVAGDEASIQAVEKASGAFPADFRMKRLQNTHAFHSRLLDAVVPGLLQRARELDFKTPTIPIEACSNTDDWSEITPEKIASHTRMAVHFMDAVRRVEQKIRGPIVWLEAGSGSPVIPMLKRAISSQSSSYEHVYVPTSLRNSDAQANLAKATSHL
ncbi:hypothetical protein BJ170DRAFT_678944 [Xylariales sp. AK1849]|nr:hypothetical protein BJ170DRAFT_678944 [Xylariales sp. AK1849]